MSKGKDSAPKYCDTKHAWVPDPQEDMMERCLGGHEIVRLAQTILKIVTASKSRDWLKLK